ncbi:MAG: ABC transporter permease [Phycisphaeraceae bacterium]
MTPDHSAAEETIIRPPSGWLSFNLGEAWTHREMLLYLVQREISGIYRQSILGLAWALISPIVLLGVFSVVFGNFIGVSAGGDVPYPVFVFAGLLPWQFFQAACSEATRSLVTHRHLLQKVYIPRIYLPLTSVGLRLVDLVMGLFVLLGVMVIYGVVPPWQIAFLPLLLIHTVVLTTSVGLLFAGLNARFRDIGFGLPFALQMLMYLSPVIYPSRAVPENLAILYSINPIAGLIDGFRSCIIGSEWNVMSYAMSLGMTFILAFVGLVVFRRAETYAVDVA